MKNQNQGNSQGQSLKQISITVSKKTLKLVGIALAVIVVGIIALRIIDANKTYRSVLVEKYSGEVCLDRDGKEKKIYEDLLLIDGDKVTTGDSSSINLLIDSDKHVKVYPNTCFKLHADGDEEEGKIKISLLYGEGLFKIDRKLADGSEFMVTTPNASMSVRGTEFDVQYDIDSNVTYVGVSEGKVWVSDGKDEVILSPGDTCSIREDGILSIVSGQEEITNQTSEIDPDVVKKMENMFDYSGTYVGDEGYVTVTIGGRQNAVDNDGDNCWKYPVTIQREGEQYDFIGFQIRSDLLALKKNNDDRVASGNIEYIVDTDSFAIWWKDDEGHRSGSCVIKHDFNLDEMLRGIAIDHGEDPDQVKETQSASINPSDIVGTHTGLSCEYDEVVVRDAGNGGYSVDIHMWKLWGVDNQDARIVGDTLEIYDEDGDLYFTFYPVDEGYELKIMKDDYAIKKNTVRGTFSR